MWLILIIWFLVILFSTLFISQYIKIQKRSDVAIAFYVLYITMAQILAAKIGDFGLGITAPVAVLIFPFTFQITDMVNEAFGRKEVHRMIFIAFVSQILMTIFIWFSIDIPPAQFWDISGNQTYWISFLGSTIRITAASWISFLITENLDAIIYSKIRKLTKGKNLWIRNLFSDIPMLALDSFIFVTIAFLGVMDIWPLIWGQLLTKWFFGVLDTPFIYLARGIIEDKIDPLGGLINRMKRTNN